jgi:tetratricopeptide (TPR) repeat protein
MDAARLADDNLDQETANRVAGAYGLPASAADSFVGQHRLRKTADPRAGAFLRKLAAARASRILISTRLYPADSQALNGEPIPGSFALFLPGLTENDALDLWRAFKVTGSRDELLVLFRTFDCHPLLIQALASEVATFRKAPGDFDKWRKAHRNFDPFRLPLVQVKSHVLEFALRGLDPPGRKVLQTVAAFRMPVSHDSLAALLVGGDGEPAQEQGLLGMLKGVVRETQFVKFQGEADLDKTLAALEDRGLLGWDRRANRYDLHPIVRGVIWSGLDESTRHTTYGALETHFKSLPTVEYERVNCLEDLTGAIELYNTLAGLGRYDDAFVVFRDRLENATHYRLSASRQRAELLEMLFPDGLDQLPRLSNPRQQGSTLNSLAIAYQASGEPGHAVPLYGADIAICEEGRDRENLTVVMCNLMNALRDCGSFRESEAAGRRALSISRELKDAFLEAYSLHFLGVTLAGEGAASEAEAALLRSLQMFRARALVQSEGIVNGFLAQRALWVGEPAAARPLAERAWRLAHERRFERDFIRAARLQGQAALGLNDLANADERLHHALTRARAVNFAEEELPALVALAELRRRQGDLKTARDLLDDVWESAERGPYPLLHADALNVLAQIERDAGNRDAAIAAATKAYRLAWCDGPPYAYHWGLEAAKKHLAALGAPEPTDLAPFDESKFEPMPQIEIDPQE